ESFLRWYAGTMHSGRKLYVHCIRGIGLDLRRRLALELLNLGDRFGSAGPRGTLIGINISHEVLAGIVGASRQQVTQHLNEFDRENVIAREGRRIIINLARPRRVIEAAREASLGSVWEYDILALNFGLVRSKFKLLARYIGNRGQRKPRPISDSCR
ncbi:MAG TPA: helix-turn-helix domain-containing protein, partial [Candidatus Acidoferrales bacterium]|nr:helix-turn-helix domain-containing protein [Candidatus Acidoferrales bacterium]